MIDNTTNRLKAEAENSDPVSRSSLFSFFASFAIIAYISRIAELVPQLGRLRINLVLFVVAFALLFITGSSRAVRWKENRELSLLFLFIIATFPGIILGVWPGNSVLTLRTTLFINMALFIFCQALITEEKHLFSVAKLLLLSCAILLVGLIFKPIVVEGNRITTTFTYDPNDLALLLSFAFPIVTAFFVTSRFIGKVISVSIILGLLMGVVKTGSRGGMLALGVSILLIFFSKGMRLAFFYKLMVILLVILFTLSPKGQGMRDRFSRLLSGQDYNITNSESVAGGRLAIWKSGLTLMKTYGITGVGVGNSAVAMGEDFGDTAWKTMHNSYLQAALEMGLFGLFVFLLMLYQIWKNTRYIIRRYPPDTKDSNEQKLLSLATAIQISLFSYLVSAFFLSQAYSLIVPVILAISGRFAALTTPPSSEEEVHSPHITEKKYSINHRSGKGFPSRRRDPPASIQSIQ